jgi:thiamine biosynthesis lipoprotein
MAETLGGLYEYIGQEVREFRCCDTEFVIQATGIRAVSAVDTVRRKIHHLEQQLDAFDDSSAVSKLNSKGEVQNEHIARLVNRGLEYYDRTNQLFDIHQGRVEQDLKAYLRGDEDTLPESFETGTITVEGDHVSADVPLDLNGLAKGYIVDQAATTLQGLGRNGFVSGGGDMSPPTGPVAVESPYDDEKPLRTLDTNWAVASSGDYRRHRGGTDHVYDPTSERLSSRHESVTVLSRRDCMEADALATTLSALPLDDALSLAEGWDGLESLVIHDGIFHSTDGFDSHVMDT